MSDPNPETLCIEIPDKCLEFDDAGFCSSVKMAHFNVPSIDVTFEKMREDMLGRHAGTVAVFSGHMYWLADAGQVPPDYPRSLPWSLCRDAIKQQMHRMALEAQTVCNKLEAAEVAKASQTTDSERTSSAGGNADV